MLKSRWLRLFAFGGLLLAVMFTAPAATTVQAAAGINTQMNYQARLLTSSGAVVPDGTYNIEFKIYQDGTGCVSGGTSPCGGTLKWTETRVSTDKVTVKNGYFSVQLGSVTAFGTSVDWNQDTLWLSTNIGGTGTPTWDGEMLPFRRMSASPYALNSKQLGGLDWSKFLQIAPASVQADNSTVSSIFLNKTNSGNVLQLQRNGVDVLSLTTVGALTLQNSTDSINALQVLTTVADGSHSVLNVDTTNERVGIGGAASASKLEVTGGDIAVYNSGNDTKLILGDSTAPGQNGFLQWDSANDYFRIESVGTNGLKINDNFVSIGNIFPDTPLKVGSGSTVLFSVSATGDTNVKTSTNSTTGFKVEKTDGSDVFTVDTSGSIISLGQASNNAGQLNFYNSGGANAVAIKAGSASAAYTLTLPTVAPAVSECLKAGASTATLLVFGSCGGGGGTLPSSYAAGSAGNQTITLNGTQDSIIVSNPASSGTDSGYTMLIEQLNTGAVDGLRISSVGTGALLKVTDATSTASDVLVIADGGAVDLKNQTDSGTAFRVLSSTASSSVPVFTVDTANFRVNIGSATSDGTGIRLVLDSKNTTPDPTGVDGAMYYNSNLGKFRCFQASVWMDCVAGNLQEFLQAEMRTVQNTVGELDDGDHIKFANVRASSGTSISLDTTTTYTQAGGASVGRFTLAAGKTYKLAGNVSFVEFSGTTGCYALFAWYNVTGAAQIGSIIFANPVTRPDNYTTGDNVDVVFTPGVSSLVELRLIDGNCVSGVASTTLSAWPQAMIEVIGGSTQVAQFVGATAGTAGISGFVPGAAAGQQGAVLLGDSTWSAGVSFINGAATFQNTANSTTAFRVLSDTGSSSVPQLVVDTTSSRVYIGNPTADGTGALLVLDDKNTAGDPGTSVDGSMYYNSSAKSFRCRHNSLWQDCDFASLRAEWVLQEDFGTNTITAGTGASLSNIGDKNWTFVSIGTGGTLGKVDVGGDASNQDRYSVLQMNSTTTVGTGASLRLDNTGMAGVPSNMVLEFAFGPLNAAAATGQQQIIRIGLLDTITSTAPTDGIYFQYSTTTTAGNWFRCTRNNTAETCTDTGTPYTTTANQYQRFRIATNAAGTTAEFFINEVSVGTNSTNVPAAARSHGPTINASTVDATTRQWKIDYFQIKRNLTTLR